MARTHERGHFAAGQPLDYLGEAAFPYSTLGPLDSA